MQGPLLDIKGLDVRFNTEQGPFQALRNVSLSVQRGRITAVVGESGSGKSVTSLSILKLLAPNATYQGGQVIFIGADGIPVDLLKQEDAALRALRGHKISMIFQEPMTSLNPLMRCGRQVAESLIFHKKISKSAARQQTIALFEKVKLPDPETMYRRYPHQLSGGQKQRVMIAMAMSCGPDLLIADEPTTALDVTVQKTILALIREWQQEVQMGVIFITHDLGLVSEIADEVVVMYKGEVVEKGTVREVLESPVHPYTKALIACRPGAHARGTRLPTVADFMGGESAVQTALPHAPTPVTGNLLEVANLNVWFPSAKNFFGRTTNYVKAVDNVTFNLREGETLGLVGESGCGKTTLGRALLRLIDPTSGTIQYRGEELTLLSGEQLKPFRKEIQIIFQDPYSSLNPRMPVGSAIAEVMRVHGIGANDRQREEKATEWLEKVGLKAEHFRRYPHEFSGGQRQRIGIARALALNPGFVVCDESVSALDVSVQAQVLNLLNDLKREMGFTTVFISHDLGVVHYISDRIMVMQKGKIEEIGEADTVFYKPQSPYTRKLLEAIPGRNFTRF